MPEILFNLWLVVPLMVAAFFVGARTGRNREARRVRGVFDVALNALHSPTVLMVYNAVDYDSTVIDQETAIEDMRHELRRYIEEKERRRSSGG